MHYQTTEDEQSKRERERGRSQVASWLGYTATGEWEGEGVCRVGELGTDERPYYGVLIQCELSVSSAREPSISDRLLRVRLEAGDSLAVERRSVRRDTILGEDAVMPDETSLVKRAPLNGHDAPDLLDASLVEALAVLARPLANVLLEVEVGRAHAALPLLGEGVALQRLVVRQTGHELRGQVGRSEGEEADAEVPDDCMSAFILT